MITKLAAKNFKSWRDTGEIRLAPITVFFGSNSSGKSSLLQLLLMLKQTAESSDRAQVLNLGGDERSLVDLGTFQDVVFGHDLGKALAIDLEWKLPGLLSISEPSPTLDVVPLTLEGKELGFSAEIEYATRRASASAVLQTSAMKYRFSGETFGVTQEAYRAEGYNLNVAHGSAGFEFVKGPAGVGRVYQPAKCYSFGPLVRSYYLNAGFLADFEFQFENLCGRIYYLGPLRERLDRRPTRLGSRPSSLGVRGERAIDALLASADEFDGWFENGELAFMRNLEERVAGWLQRLGLIDSFVLRPITEESGQYQIWVRRDPASAEVLITDVGFGVSQILPVITLCHYVPRGSVVLLEQPEIHLHPKVQADLADFLIDVAANRDVQIILESHSEHLLRRLQRRIADETMTAHDAAFYFCAAAGGESRLTPLDLDPYGTITNWPDGFFGDDFAEIAATSQAVLARKKAKAP